MKDPQHDCAESVERAGNRVKPVNSQREALVVVRSMTLFQGKPGTFRNGKLGTWSDLVDSSAPPSLFGSNARHSKARFRF